MPELPRSGAGKRAAGQQHSEIYRHAGAFLVQRHTRRGGSRYRLLAGDEVDVDTSLGELENYRNGLPISVPDHCVPKSIRCVATGSRNATGVPVRVFPDGRVEAIPGGAPVDLSGVPRRQRRGMHGM